jgi:heterodisulfide reductase subunit C
MLDYNSLDTKFREQVVRRPGGERASYCYQCGTCTAGCPVSNLRSEYNPRTIMKKLLLGMKDEVLSSPELWQCSQCHICVAHCPQDVRFADVIRVLRELALEEGYVSAEFVERVERLDDELRQLRIGKIKELNR